MRLRRLFYCKVGQLCRERKALLSHMANEQDVGANIGLDDVSVRLSEVSDFAEQLRANGADEYKTYMQFSSAFSRGVNAHAVLGQNSKGYLVIACLIHCNKPFTLCHPQPSVPIVRLCHLPECALCMVVHAHGSLAASLY